MPSASPAASSKKDPFDAYEQLPTSYHKDARWKEVRRLRATGEHAKANGLVMQIRSDYGFEG